MREIPGRPSDVDVVMACDWCGGQETLPADAAERVKALRIKAAERGWAEEAARGPAVALAKMMEGGASGIFGSVATNLAFMVIFMAAAAGIVALDRGAGGMASSPAPLGVPPLLGALLGVAIAFRIARRRVTHVLRPLLTAAPAPQPGALLRCRRCGADLPGTHLAIVGCRHCHAENLVSHAAMVERAALLEDATLRSRRAAIDGRSAIEGIRRTVGLLLSGGVFAGFFLGVAVSLALVM